MEKVNKTELKNFAIQSRRQLIDQVKTKTLMYGIDEKNDLEIQEQFGQLMINDKPYPLYMKPAFNSLKNQLKQKGYKQLVEEVAYTWFNRIIAIRYMEVHDYLPEKVNVLSSSVGRVDPDILFEYETMDLPVKQEEIRHAINNGDIEGAYRQLFIAQSNALNKILPFLFEKIHDYTELLLPDFLLDAESVIKVLVRNEELTKGFEEIEVIGWLYQYYMAEKKEYIGGLKNTAVKKEDLPVVTQLFTPKWIVQYMLENTLGTIYLDNLKTYSIKENWEYYLHPDEESTKLEGLKLEDIKIIDPACGSGHILIHAFDMLYEMYEEQGYVLKDIPKLILENNIYGLEIDKRACQIAKFTIAMKSIEKHKRLLHSYDFNNINIVEFIDYVDVPRDVFGLIDATDKEIEKFYEYKEIFINAKQFGSIINVEEDFIFDDWIQKIESIKKEDLDLINQLSLDALKEYVLPILKQCKLLIQKYQVLVTNPPYHNKYNNELKKYCGTYYDKYNSDLYSIFIKRAIDWVEENGYIGFMTPYTWLYISSHEILRSYVLDNTTIKSLIELEYSAFKDATVPICTFVLNKQTENRNGNYVKLSEFKGAEQQPIRVKEVVKNPKLNYIFHTSPLYYSSIEGKPISYWIDEKSSNTFKSKYKFKDAAVAKKGLDTNGESGKFIFYWFEVDKNKIYSSQVPKSNAKWFELNKGGGFKKWYGNNLDVINYENNGYTLKNKPKKANIRNESLYFKESLTYGVISSSKFSFRYSHEYSIFDQGGPNCFPTEDDLFYMLALGNSNVISHLLAFIAPTLNFTVGDINKLPVIYPEKDVKFEIETLAKENLYLSKIDWDQNEYSIDFKKHVFLEYKSYLKLENIALEVQKVRQERFNKVKDNELELNQYFNRIYNLEDVVSAQVLNSEITIAQKDVKQEINEFLSYFIGCTLGRYSLDYEGVQFTGGEFEENNYISFKPAKNGVLHLTEKAYFENDIIIYLRKFLASVFSSDTVDENIQWLAEVLEMKNGEDSEARLRRYFLEEFYAEHCKAYQKCPIYWLLDSGKQKGLRTLIYMHRYQPDTMATIRFEHLQEIQAKYQNEITDLENRLVNPNLSASEMKKLSAEKTSFEKKMDELREFDKRLAAIANEEIEIDLDDGVKVNYEKFYRGGKGVLAKIK